MPHTHRIVHMGLQPEAHSFGETQQQTPPNYSHRNPGLKLDHEHSAQQVQQLLHLRRELLRDARKRGDDAEVHRLENLGLLEDVLPQAQRLGWQQIEGLWVKNSDIMKKLPDLPNYEWGNEAVKAQYAYKSTKGKRSLTIHQNSHIDVQPVYGQDFEIVIPPPLHRGSSKRATRRARRDTTTTRKATVKRADDGTHGAEKLRSSPDPLSTPSSGHGLTTHSQTTAPTSIDDFDPFLKQALASPPRVPARSARRPRARATTLPGNVAFASASTAALVPAPLFSREGAPMKVTETARDRADVELRVKQLEGDMQALDDFKGGLFDPGEREIDIIWARLQEGVEQGLIAL